ncbi:hypothetical protein GWR56_20270 [Mucilaginibacter sp. 14171R-50]|uniref:hypothetical protein n=1 Tax=Mucilaginibacter sp. 14171R-50 TaxID=2703789 RepID=UPI00138BC0C0|nr:hypothetical protein [Mucilaginibacter sp. 14171R-50]QHS57767.1 hypothetical protein GWR56_20270 [Mucilaginibacter sp. 14171R-50]
MQLLIKLISGNAGYNLLGFIDQLVNLPERNITNYLPNLLQNTHFYKTPNKKARSV